MFHPSLFILAVSLSLAASIPAVASLPASEIVSVQRPAVEFIPRGGLPNFFVKAEKGGPVTIAYLGGSITAQNGWRVQSRAWLQQQFPKAQIREINAAIGGTGSDLGVFRVEADALKGRPDLLFVEFAVNDAGSAPDQIREAMEGIVRKTWRELPETDICFVYTVTDRDTPGVVAGKMSRSASVMEEVADHYGIPSIHFGIEVARMEKDGKLVMKSSDTPMTRVSGDELNAPAKMPVDAQGRIVFSKDGVHPYPETGHVLYTEALERSFKKMRATGRPGAHALGAPLAAGNWESAREVVIDGGLVAGRAERLDPKADGVAKAFATRLPVLWRFDPGASLRFKFRGTKVSIYDLLGPDGAMLRVSVDGKSQELARFDGYCTYRRLGMLGVADNLPDAVHEVIITVLPEKPDKEKLLFDRNRADFEAASSKYAPTVWYAGEILIVGEPVE